MIAQSKVEVPIGCGALDVEQLNISAAKALEQMFNPKSGLFCYKLRERGGSLVQEGISHRYTLMTLLGLSRSQAARHQSSSKIDSVLHNMAADLRWMDNLGDLGLLIWTFAVIAPDRLEALYERCDPATVFGRYPEFREGRTMELAWLLAGLSHALLANSPGDRRLRHLAQQTYFILRQNQGIQGSFGHLASRGGLSGWIRGRIGSFADQVYPIYALSIYAQAHAEHAHSALKGARDCADHICSLQGKLGQWWWHYDSVTGRVAERYPVYSVHQEGMAPMALFALSEASGIDYTAPIYRGLHWISGQNEAHFDLRHESGLVWRCLQRRTRFGRYWDRVETLFANSEEPVKETSLTLLRECRPYELGWLLYAFSGRG